VVLRFLEEYSASTAMSVLNKCDDPWNDFIHQKQNDCYLSSALDQQLTLVAVQELFKAANPACDIRCRQVHFRR